MTRPKRRLISRRNTLEVALRVIDEEGLEALSIRRLGRELDVQGISLYHHFKNKEEILIGVCELALAEVRTPNNTDTDWREWLMQNAKAYRKALLAHPHLVPILMKRHPLRIGLPEHNATAGLLVVLGVPRGAVIPLLEGLEVLALGSVSYRSAVQDDKHADSWKVEFPNLFHLSKASALDHDELFEAMARALIDGVVNAVAAKGQCSPEEAQVAGIRARA